MSEEQKNADLRGIAEDKDEGFCTNFNYEKCKKVRTFSTVFAAILLAVVAVSKVAVAVPAEGTPANSFIMTFYFCVIAIAMVAVEYE